MRIKSSLRGGRRPTKQSSIWILDCFAALAMTMFVIPAHAQEQANTETFCHLLAEHTPSADVEYKPGVDVHGKPVVPADLGQPLNNFETIEIPVELDLAQKFGLNTPAGIELKPYVALVSIHKDGKVDYNGQDISKQAYQLCNEGKNDEPAASQTGKTENSD